MSRIKPFVSLWGVPYLSPFEPFLRSRGAVYGLVGDVRVPLHFGDPAREIEALRHASAAVELPWRAMVEVTGRDRVRFLHGMCTNDIRRLQPGEGCMAAIVNRQGKMVAEIIVRALPDRLYVETDRTDLQTTLDALRQFVVADDVKFALTPMNAWGRYGPAFGTLPDLNPFDFLVREGALISVDLTLGLPGFLRWNVLDQPVEREGAGPYAGFQAYETLRIENGFPRWGADMGPEVLPMEAGLEPISISYTKGCYLGQEVIQRVKTYSEPPKTLVQLRLDGTAVPERGASIEGRGQEVGTVTSASFSPLYGQAVALGYVRKEHKAPGSRVTVASRLGATVLEPPWTTAMQKK